MDAGRTDEWRESQRDGGKNREMRQKDREREIWMAGETER